jgi:hypothetical protein
MMSLTSRPALLPSLSSSPSLLIAIDRLYFEELTLERVLDIYELERSKGAIVSVGGQIPNNLAMGLHQNGAKILGTSPDNINKAEDRHLFSALLDKIKVDQPKWKELTTESDVFAFAAEVGYPVSSLSLLLPLLPSSVLLLWRGWVGESTDENLSYPETVSEKRWSL